MTDDADPRVERLSAAVSRLRRELAALRGELTDRGIAEDELAALAAMTLGGPPPEPHRLRRSLLLVAGAIGSVSALAAALAEVRTAIERFGPVRPGEPPVRGVVPPPRGAPRVPTAEEKPVVPPRECGD
ncbi:DUF5955 family protein [Streptomyces coeruleoprunus]|uniref:DUF5955 family protein n=1 Tax=Streptomyces coeruleoprunus TaxID=285563 RepID=A0ABV9XD23_9ACTN